MESKKSVETALLKVSIVRGDVGAGDESVKMVFNDLESVEVNLNNSSVSDIKKLFDTIFEYDSPVIKEITWLTGSLESEVVSQPAPILTNKTNKEINDFVCLDSFDFFAIKSFH